MLTYPTLKEAQRILKQGEYKNIPIGYQVDLGEKNALDIFQILRNVSQNTFILESVDDEKNWGRYTFLGFDPKLEITCLNKTVTIQSGTRLSFENTCPHSYIRQIIRENKTPHIEGLPTFTGGLVGYFSYEFITYSEPSLVLSTTSEDFNDMDLMLFDKVIAIDNLEHKIIFMVNIATDNLETNYNHGILSLQQMASLVENGTPKPEESYGLESEFTPSFNREVFCDMVNQAKAHIIEGDIFQVVLSNLWEASFKGSLIDTYRKLRKSNPSPYMFYFSSNNIEISGASPETLVKLDRDKLYTFPLAGTRPRGKTEAEDMALERELLSDEKECAEHNMLVDLGRNDVGKISKIGSVFVEKYMEIERFSHVMHIGSTVCGTIREDKDALDAIDAILPAGTLSGAPKLKACEIIHKIEKNRRGIYGGAIGYLDFSGNVDTCIAIRLAYKKNDKVYVRSGAGIVADSVPENEYEECINKTKAVINALKETK